MTSKFSQSHRPTARDRVPEKQHDDRAEYGDEHRRQVEAEDVEVGDAAKDRAADERTHKAEHDVDDAARASPIDDFAGDETGDRTKHNPTQYGHARPLFCRNEKVGYSLSVVQGESESLWRTKLGICEECGVLWVPV